jgi:L-aspartate oxidase
VRETAARILEHTFVSDLVVSDGRVVGVDVLDSFGRAERLEADSVILASGGAGQLYRHTTNPGVATGDGVAAALRAGALLGDVEFYQFHPTALAVPGNFLVSEAVRGEGAVLLDANGRRFMTDWHPDGELAPRDVVARGIARQMAAQDGAPVLLDATALGADYLAERFPAITRACLANGLDWAREPIPVTPAAHYWMGGVVTDEWGRTSLPGLFAVGEVACTGVHGANRLASNSLLESLVFAWRAASRLDDAARLVDAGRLDDADWPEMTSSAEAGAFPVGGGAESFTRAELQQLMWHEAGVFRHGEGLRRASDTLARWTVADATTVAAREDANLLELSRLVVTAALSREESRGAHYRSDFPTAQESFTKHLEWVALEPARKVAVAC